MDWTLAYNGNDDIIDSRDMYKRQDELERLESDRDDATAEYESALTDYNLALQGDGDETGELKEALDRAAEAMKEAQDAFGEIEAEELEILKTAENEIDGYMHGTTLIHETHFKEYAKSYARDVVGINRDDYQWPLNCIDWDEAAEQLRSDFSEVIINGETYYFS